MQKRYIIGAGIAALALVGLGTTIGDNHDTVRTVPAPTVTVTPDPVIMRVAPQACLDAIAAADTLDGTQFSALDAAGDGFMAVSELDVDALQAANDRLQGLQQPMLDRSAAYARLADECRAAKGDV